MPNFSHFPLHLYCRQLIELFQQALSQPNPAWWLYKNQARAPLFMAESLTRVLAGVPGVKKAEKASGLFKKLEDILGKIDDYDHLAAEFEKYPAVKKEEVTYFLKKRDKQVNKLNAMLAEKEFYQEAFYKITRQLNVDFNKEGLVPKLKEQISYEIKKCFRFYSIFKNGFTDMEGQVHEIRRKLRWLSIYAESFNGLIVLEKSKTHFSWEKKYITAKAKDDPFNILVINKKFKVHIKFNQAAFYALNKVVADLGDIKDKGLQIDYLKKSIHKTFKVSEEDALQLALKQLKPKQNEKELLHEAHVLLKNFFVTNAIHEALL